MARPLQQPTTSMYDAASVNNNVLNITEQAATQDIIESSSSLA